MPHYSVVFAVAEVHVTVDAEDEEAAEEAAHDLLADRHYGLCWQCSEKAVSCDPYKTSILECPPEEGIPESGLKPG